MNMVRDKRYLVVGGVWEGGRGGGGGGGGGEGVCKSRRLHTRKYTLGFHKRQEIFLISRPIMRF